MGFDRTRIVWFGVFLYMYCIELLFESSKPLLVTVVVLVEGEGTFAVATVCRTIGGLLVLNLGELIIEVTAC